MNDCYGCGGSAIANVGIPVCVACSYIAGCNLYHYDADHRLHCDDPEGWHELEAIKQRVRTREISPKHPTPKTSKPVGGCDAGNCP